MTYIAIYPDGQGGYKWDMREGSDEAVEHSVIEEGGAFASIDEAYDDADAKHPDLEIRAER